MADLTVGKIPVATGAAVLDDSTVTQSAAGLLFAGKTLRLTPSTFGTLPTGAVGMIAYISDSSTATWGATIAGGGANDVIGFFNGTNWTVMGV